MPTTLEVQMPLKIFCWKETGITNFTLLCFFSHILNCLDDYSNASFLNLLFLHVVLSFFAISFLCFWNLVLLTAILVFLLKFVKVCWSLFSIAQSTCLEKIVTHASQANHVLDYWIDLLTNAVTLQYYNATLFALYQNK